MPVSVRGKKPANAPRQVANSCRSACDRRQESGQEKKPSNDCKKSDDANGECRAARSRESSESVETVGDRTQGNRDSQKDKPEAWPSGRESRKQLLQFMPPAQAQRTRMRLALLIWNLTPRSSAFFPPLCRTGLRVV